MSSYSHLTKSAAMVRLIADSQGLLGKDDITETNIEDNFSKAQSALINHGKFNPLVGALVLGSIEDSPLMGKSLTLIKSEQYPIVAAPCTKYMKESLPLTILAMNI